MWTALTVVHKTNYSLFMEHFIDKSFIPGCLTRLLFRRMFLSPTKHQVLCQNFLEHPFRFYALSNLKTLSYEIFLMNSRKIHPDNHTCIISYERVCVYIKHSESRKFFKGKMRHLVCLKRIHIRISVKQNKDDSVNRSDETNYLLYFLHHWILPQEMSMRVISVYKCSQQFELENNLTFVYRAKLMWNKRRPCKHLYLFKAVRSRKYMCNINLSFSYANICRFMMNSKLLVTKVIKTFKSPVQAVDVHLSLFICIRDCWIQR